MFVVWLFRPYRHCSRITAVHLLSPCLSPLHSSLSSLLCHWCGHYWCGGGGGGNCGGGGGCSGGGCGCGWIVPVWGLFGDTACHVIGVGTCCPNVLSHMWAGSSAVKRVLYC